MNVIPADPSLAPWEAHGSTRLLVIDDPEGAVLLAPPIARVRSYKLPIALCAVLGIFGTLAVPAVRRALVLRWAIHEIETTTDAGTALRCCESLEKIGPPARSAAPVVWALHFRKFAGGYALKETFINSVVEAIDPDFLASHRPAVTPRTPQADLILALQFPDPEIRKHAATLLGDAGPAARGAVGALTSVAQRPQDSARVAAIEALGRIGPDAATAVPALLKLLSASGTIREAVVRALNQIAPGDPRVLNAIDLAGIPPPTSQPGGR